MIVEYIVIQESRATDLFILPASAIYLSFVAKKDKIISTMIHTGHRVAVSPNDGGRIKAFATISQALAFVDEQRKSDSQPTPPVE